MYNSSDHRYLRLLGLPMSLSLCLCLSLLSITGCDSEEDPKEGSGGEVMAGEEMSGEEGGEMAGEEGGEMGGEMVSGEEGGEMMSGEVAGEEVGPTCIECEVDEDCERGQSCVAMDEDESVQYCFSPCFDDGTCGGEGESCITLSHDLSLYVCSVDSCEFCYDQDGDGYGSGLGCIASDCNDADAMINSGMEDNICDGIDNDCNGLVDDDVPSQCPAPSWRVLNEVTLEDRWVIYEALFYRDEACTNLIREIETVTSSVEDEEMNALLADQIIDPMAGLPWMGGVVDQAEPNASFVSFTFANPEEVNCVVLYQSPDPAQRLLAARLQSGFDGVWATNQLMAGEDTEDAEGYPITRFHVSVCGDGVVSTLEECDSAEPYCMGCRLVYAEQGEPCFANEMELARCGEGLVCTIMEDEGQCLPPRLLIQDDYCDPADPTAICEPGLACLENGRGELLCMPEE